MRNRWSDAARLAALAVRQGRVMAAAPGKVNVAPQAGGLAPKPVTFPTKPNIFYSSAYPYGPGQEGREVQGIFRYDPVNPVDAAKLGYNMGDGKNYMPPMPPPVKPPVKPKIPTKTGSEKIGTTKIRVVIAGKRYTKVGNMYYPDTSPPPAKKLLAVTPKRK